MTIYIADILLLDNCDMPDIILYDTLACCHCCRML
jgi:hypothetical protein